MKDRRIEKKFKYYKKMIDRLQLDNQELKNENKKLQEQLEVEKNKYLEKENLLDKSILEYKKLVEENKKIKENNLKELSNLKQLKEKYNKKMNNIIRKTRRNI